MSKLCFMVVAALMMCLVVCANQSYASEIYDFEIFTSPPDPALDFTVEVIDLAGQVAFKFENNSSIASSITDVYFDDGSLLGIASLIDNDEGVGGDPGVDFSIGSSPDQLPSGQNLTPPFVSDFSTDADPGAPGVAVNGVNPGEWLTVIFDLLPGKTYDNVIDQMDLGGSLTEENLRIGLHIQALPDGSSDSAVNVPEPATVVLLAIGNGMIFLKNRKRRRLTG